MTDWFRDRLHDVSSTLTDPSNYMKLDPPTEDRYLCTSAQSRATF